MKSEKPEGMSDEDWKQLCLYREWLPKRRMMSQRSKGKTYSEVFKRLYGVSLEEYHTTLRRKLEERRELIEAEKEEL